MIQRQLKLRLSKSQEATLYEWLPMLTSIWNWSIRKIENDAQGGIYYTPKGFQNILPGKSGEIRDTSHIFILQTAVVYRKDAKAAKKACHRVFTLLFYPPHENFSLFAAKLWFSVFNRG